MRILSAIIAAALLIPAAANAAVTYTLTSSTANFSFTVPDFISGGQTFIDPSEMNSCSVPVGTCSYLSAQPSYDNSGTEISFIALVQAPDSYNYAFWFSPGTFSTPGTYQTTGGFYSGTLTVSTSTPAPEPATWAIMIAGFGLVGAMLRRRREQAALA